MLGSLVIALLVTSHALTLNDNVDEFEPCRQVLNATQEGMAYLSPLNVGGQTVKAILDTGSFEVVVEGTDCAPCPEATYNPRKSQTYTHTPTQLSSPPADPELYADAMLLETARTAMGKRAQNQLQAAARLNKENLTTISYGSGPVGVVAGMDSVSVPGCPQLKTNRIGIQEILDHRIPLLQMPGSMTAIIGMGAGQASESAKRLHHVLGSPRFSFCLASDRLQDGVVWWNEIDRSKDQHFQTMTVAGKLFWGFSMMELKMGNDLVGCAKGCGAILDTGTSLLTFDRETTNNIGNKWMTFTDCSQYTALPALTFRMGGQDVQLPPEAYVVITTSGQNLQQTTGSAVSKRLPLSPAMAKEFFKKNPQAFSKWVKDPNMQGVLEKIMARSGGSTQGIDDLIKKIIEQGGSGGEGAPDIQRIIQELANGDGSGSGSMAPPAQPACQLMLTPPMDLGMTPQGPMVIIGMPFFRTYYTTFDDTDTTYRKVLVSNALTCDGNNTSVRNLIHTDLKSAQKLNHLHRLDEHVHQAVTNAKAIAAYISAHGW